MRDYLRGFSPLDWLWLGVMVMVGGVVVWALLRYAPR